jgi:hypothetical protein
MSKATFVSSLLTTAMGLGAFAGCQNLADGRHPNEPPAAGSAAPADASLADNSHPLRRVVAGNLGAGGGFLIGASRDKLDVADKARAKADAVKASQRAEKNPAKPDDVDRAPTADLNDDGFLTLDEVVAMRQANMNDQTMLDRLRSTGHVFELTEYQQDYLRTRGVGDAVIRQISAPNQDAARTASANTHE